MSKGIDFKVCTSKKAAEMLGVNPRTIQLWADSGILKSWKTPGGHRRFSEHEVTQLANELRNATQKEIKPLRILVVEDDPSLLRLYQLTLSSWDLPIELELTSDGYSGLLKTGVFMPDLLILDLSLPNIDGFSIVKSLQENPLREEIQLIVVSGLPKQQIKEKLKETYDQITILGKPVPFEQLKELVEKCLLNKANTSSPHTYKPEA